MRLKAFLFRVGCQWQLNGFSLIACYKSDRSVTDKANERVEKEKQKTSCNHQLKSLKKKTKHQDVKCFPLPMTEEKVKTGL